MKAMRDLLEGTRVNEAVVSGQSSVVSDSSAGTLELMREAKGAGNTLAQLLKRPEVQIESLAPLLARLMPEFFARGDSSQRRVDGGLGIVDSETPSSPTPSESVSPERAPASRRICGSIHQLLSTNH